MLHVGRAFVKPILICAVFTLVFSAYGPRLLGGIPEAGLALAEPDPESRDGYRVHHQPDATGWVLHRLGKKAAGRELDGRTWDQYPR